MDAQRTPRGRRWGLSHEGAGGDSESVEQSERAVSRAVVAAPEKRRSGSRPSGPICWNVSNLFKSILLQKKMRARRAKGVSPAGRRAGPITDRDRGVAH